MKILIAEDNHFYRLALKANLTEWGYQVVEATDGGAALEALLAADAPKIALIDWLMPVLDGVEVCRRVRNSGQPEPPYLIILTSLEGKENVLQALEAGADDFVTKPFDRDQLRARLQVGRRIVGLQTSHTVVFAFARAVEAKSPYTQGHAERVTAYALALAEELGVAPTQRETLRKGAVLHDIGKISIPDDILNKEGKLTVEEYAVIKQHPAAGVKIVEPLQSLNDTLPLIRWHHERLDGAGYPDGLRGEQIPLLVRILSVADMYDALASDRPYRPALPREQCLQIMLADAEKGGLDLHLVQTFMTLPCDAFAGLPGRAKPSGSGYFPLPALKKESAERLAPLRGATVSYTA